ncbi:MAG: adenylosuccinate synthase [Candidatus Eremiobacteraeota bacterium]|nr:adenylosuccinate synthase [Candidatus Eremiobacteraeota bacterium]
MPSSKADIIVGLQWGDEGKGRVVDYYAKNYDIVARFGGGDNAGHTIVAGDTALALRIVPSGVLHENVELFIGGGTVVSLSGLVEELDALEKIGIDLSRIKISDRAHIVFPYHAERDAQREATLGDQAIGTTGRGIGPAYEDKAARAGIRFADLRDVTRLARMLGSKEEALAQTRRYGERVLPHVVDGVVFIHSALESGKRILIEGAQGTLLDVGYGTYPYVTSSHTIAGGACIGLGIGPSAIGNVIGVAKAYATRVGGGPFPSELHDADGEQLRRNGHEFGTVTGRARRCGWFDAVAARYAARLNGLTSAVITKLDVLSGFERIGLVTEYMLSGAKVDFAMADAPAIQPVIQFFDGWTEEIGAVRDFKRLPPAAQRYLSALRDALGVPLEHVSLGPERSQLV